MTRYRFDEHTQSITEKSVVPIGIFRIVDGHIAAVTASEGLCRLFGYKDLKEAAEKTDGDIFRNVHPDDVKSVADAAESFEREDTPFDPVFRIMLDGGCRLIHACGQHITAETGERLAVVWFIDEGAVMSDAKPAHHKDNVDESKRDKLLSALSDNYLSIYTVDLQTGHFSAYEICDFFKGFGFPTEGDDFFTAAGNISLKYIYREDTHKFMSLFTRDNVMSSIQESGIFALEYRILHNIEPLHICLKAAKSKENDQELIIGFVNIDAQKKREMQYESKQLSSWEKVNKDPLTGVKNKHCFDGYKEKLRETIDRGEMSEVAIGMFDCDNLNQINDRYGYDKGNLYLTASCRLICKVIKHSPVFRIGGDEFAVILQREDYQNIDTLLQQFQEEQNKISSSTKKAWEKVSVSFGIAVYCPQFDHSIEDLIRRTNQLMYDNKHARKQMSKRTL